MPVELLTHRYSTVQALWFCDVVFLWLYTLDQKNHSAGKW